MDVAPFQLIGAFLAACLVLAVARVVERYNLRWQFRFSLSTLIILVTAFAGIMTLVAVYLKK